MIIINPPEPARGRTVSPEESIAGRPGVPHFFHFGLGGENYQQGTVGASAGNPFAFVPSPNLVTSVRHFNAGQVRDGLTQSRVSTAFRIGTPRLIIGQ